METLFSVLRAGSTRTGCKVSAMADGAAVETTDPAIRAEIVGNVRRFVEREVLPQAIELEHADEFPEAIVAQMRAMGLFGLTIPEAYGGLGLDLLTYIGVIEELSYGWMSLSGIINTHTMLATILMHHGTDEQRQRWLPSMATGEKRGALSLSEPDAGSDTRSISCRAVRDGDEWVVNGTKAWVTNGERAALVVLAAKTDAGVSAFIVEKEPGPKFEGISVSKKVGKLGYKGIDLRQAAAGLRSSARWRSAGSTSRPVPSGWRARRSTRRSATPSCV